MGAKLHIQIPGAESFEVTIGNTTTIGRTKESAVCLAACPLASRQHAIIRCHNGYQYQIIDLGSRNGTFVNDQRVVVPVTLQDGAKIRIANAQISFHEVAEAASEEEATIAGSMDGAAVQSRPVAILVCDIRGFSTKSEATDSSALAQLLGAWFREIGALVSQTGGTIDKFIGDAVLAYWAGTQDAARDCTAAFETARAIMECAEKRAWPNGDPFKVAVSMHYGKVTCSNVGVAAERDATIIGDAVNTVFRLETVAKEVARPLIASHDLVQHLPNAAEFEDFGERALKGKANLVRVMGWGKPI